MCGLVLTDGHICKPAKKVSENIVYGSLVNKTVNCCQQTLDEQLDAYKEKTEFEHNLKRNNTDVIGIKMNR